MAHIIDDDDVEDQNLEGFWGLVVQPGQSFQQTVESSFCITNATFGPNGNFKGENRTAVVVTIEKSEFVLATLITNKIENVPVKVHFTEGQSVVFSVTGNNAVHLTGYYLPPPHGLPYYDEEDDDDMEGYYDDEDDEDEDDDEDDEDEDAVALKLAQIAKGSKSVGKLTPIEEDEDDEDDDEFEDIDDEEEEDEDEDEQDEIVNEGLNALKRKLAEKDIGKKAQQQQQQQPNKKQAVPDNTGKPVKQQQQQQQKTESKPNTPAKPAKQDSKPATPATTPGKESKPATPAAGAKTPNATTPTTTKTLPGGLIVKESKSGEGKPASKGKKVSLRYVGKLDNGKVFDSNTSGKPFSFKVGGGQVIKGMDSGIEGMKVGGERTLIIPAALGYGASGAPPDIPKNARLTFDIKLLSVD